MFVVARTDVLVDVLGVWAGVGREVAVIDL